MEEQDPLDEIDLQPDAEDATWEEGSALPEATSEVLPMVAVVGRPNVGKSTLFNRIIGRRKAVVHDRPGVTRDRNIERAEWEGVPFLCVDTGGYEIELDDPLLEEVVEQVRLAIDEADVIVLLASVHETVHPADAAIVGILREIKKPVIIAVNKCDNPSLEMESQDFYRYGFEHIFPVAALHGVGIGDMLSQVVAEIKALPPDSIRHQKATGAIALAIVGRQNVGKSTMVNRLAGTERVIAADLPGTTRDAIDLEIIGPNGRHFSLIDTAGIRRRGKIERGIERLSVTSSQVAMQRADVAVLVIDAKQGLTEQDAHIAGACVEEGLATIVVVNKWDAVSKDHRTADEFTKHLHKEWGFLRFAPVLYASGLTGQRTHKILELAEELYENASRRIKTSELNELLQMAIARRPPPAKAGKRPRIKYITQVAVRPPTFALFVNDPSMIHFSYRRYLLNQLRRAYGFEGSPIRLYLRATKRKEFIPER